MMGGGTISTTEEAAAATNRPRPPSLTVTAGVGAPSTAALTGYVNDRDVKRRIANALSLLLSQGRAVGVTVLAATSG
jgi:hypothetical protein